MTITSLEVFALAGDQSVPLGRRRLAALLGISLPATYHWGRYVPAHHVRAAAAAINRPVDDLLADYTPR